MTAPRTVNDDDRMAATRRLNGLLAEIARTRGLVPPGRAELLDRLRDACHAATHESWIRGRREGAAFVLDQLEGLEWHAQALIRSSTQLGLLLDSALREAGRTPDRDRRRWHDPLFEVFAPLRWIWQETGPGSTSPRAQLRHHVELALARLGELSGFRYLDEGEGDGK